MNSYLAILLDVKNVGASKGLLSSLVVTGILLSMNIFVAPRDGSWTAGMSTFEVRDLVQERLWTESPVQVLYTFMGGGAKFERFGVAGDGGFDFTGRLALRFGESNIDSSKGPVDLRALLSDEDLDYLRGFVQRLSYRSTRPCPHDYKVDCTIAVGWNRDRTKESGVKMIGTRIDETVYLIVDDSVVLLGTQ
jgi:hypothetical protein